MCEIRICKKKKKRTNYVNSASSSLGLTAQYKNMQRANKFVKWKK